MYFHQIGGTEFIYFMHRSVGKEFHETHEAFSLHSTHFPRYLVVLSVVKTDTDSVHRGERNFTEYSSE